MGSAASQGAKFPLEYLLTGRPGDAAEHRGLVRGWGVGAWEAK